MSYANLLRCRTVFFSCVLLVMVSGCNGGGGSSTAPANSNTGKLVKLTDSGKLEQYLKKELVNVYSRQELRYHYAGLRSDNAAAPAFDMATIKENSSSPQTTGTQPPAHSETNVQEIGVDEGDLIKTDGNFIYVARGSRFLVLNSQPPEQAAIVSDIDLKEPINELYLANGRVSIITSYYNSPIGLLAAPAREALPSSLPTRLYSFDITIPTAPVLTARYEFPGALQGSRRINNTLYIVTNHHIDIPNPVTPWDYMNVSDNELKNFTEASAKAKAENLKRIDSLTLDGMIPNFSRTLYAGGSASAPVVATVIDSADIFVPESGNGTDLSLVIAIDTSAPAPTVSSSGVLSSWCGIYMSTESLYLTSGNSWFWIEPVVGSPQPMDNPEPWTAVHKFSVAGGLGKPLYKGSGVVNGWTNNQFSLNEYQGFLRIGTTRGGWWGEGISNQLAVMVEQDGKLMETGKIEKIAPGERIYSMRFDRENGYMVTFRQTDPLFTFDLSDPNNPRIVGEIKVNGFATYIQIIGQNSDRLLTVGQSADDSGRVTGNKLQLFDVSNLAAPRLMGDYELGSGWSAALYDHHAFLYYQPLGLLTIPYYSYSSAPDGYSSGLRVFTVDENGIAQRGIIPAQVVSSDYGSYLDTVDRAVIIGSDIYSLAHGSLTIAGSAQLDIKKIIMLPDGYRYYATMLAGGA